MTSKLDQRQITFELFQRAFDQRHDGSSRLTDEEINARNQKLSDEFEASRSDPTLTSLLARFGDENISLEIDKIIVARLLARQTRMSPVKKTGIVGTHVDPPPTYFAQLEDALSRARPDVQNARELLLKRIGRRMLEVAFHSCEGAKGPSSKERADDFGRLSEKATLASKAIEGLIGHLVPADRPDQNLIPPLLTVEIATPENAQAQLKRISADASAFRRASSAAKALAKRALAKEAKLRKDNKSEKKRSHIAFALPVAEAWTFMTDKRPSKGTERTPFLDYLQAAWIDVYGDPSKPREEQTPPSFVGAVRYVVDRAQLDSTLPPPWLNLETLLFRL